MSVKPKAATTAKRLNELVSDCVVCIGLLGIEVFLVFPAPVFSGRFLSAKAEIPVETRHLCEIFLNRLVPCCITAESVLEFAASKQLL